MWHNSGKCAGEIAQQQAKQRSGASLQCFDGDKAPDAYAGRPQKGELLGEDAGPAECDRKGCKRQPDGAGCGQRCAPARRFDQSVNGPFGAVLRSERAQRELQERAQRCQKMQIFQCAQKHAGERDKTAHAQHGYDSFLHRFAERACLSLRQRAGLRGGLRAAFPPEKFCEEKNGQHAEEVGREQDRARCALPEHGAAYAAEDEHGPGGRAQVAQSFRLRAAERSVAVQVGDDAAADRVAG